MIAVKYLAFALIATVVNLFSQHMSLSLYSEWGALYIAMIFGTLTGLICKYILDKKFIFYYEVDSAEQDFKTFVIYTLMGVITTVIFWFSELSFNHFFDHPMSKYIGATIGLSIGYLVKYQLDKKFVFINTNETASSASAQNVSEQEQS